jgi:scyllo-inositol 2-dehydrogenase (NADP+)
MSSKIKTGLLAYGMSGRVFHAPFIHHHEGFELTAIVERTVKQAQTDFPFAISYKSVEDLLADENIELVIVNTPNYTHFDFASMALDANKHVLVEKPFTVTSDEARILFEKAEGKGLHLLTYQNRRWDSDFVAVQKIVESGRLGKLVEVHFRFDRYRNSIGPKKAKETDVPGSGILYDLGPHLLDAALSLFGRPASWTKSLGKFRHATIVDDYAHIHMEYADGMQVFITMSMLVAEPQPSFVLHGTKGSFIKRRSDVQERDLLNHITPVDINYGIEDPLNEGVLTIIDDAGNKNTVLIPQERTSYMSLFNAAFETIRMGKPFPVTQEQVLQQITILED